MKKKILPMVLISGMIAVALMGCSAGSSSAAPSEAASADASQSILMGQVKAIDGKTITLAVGTRGTPNGSNGQGGGSASASGTDSHAAVSNNPSTQPSASPNGNAAGARKGGGPGGLTLTGEEQTITLTDSTTITVQNNGESATGSVSDIKTGSILSVTLSGNAVTAVTVMSGMPGNGGGIPASGAPVSGSASGSSIGSVTTGSTNG